MSGVGKLAKASMNFWHGFTWPINISNPAKVTVSCPNWNLLGWRVMSSQTHKSSQSTPRKTALQIIWPKERIIYTFCHVLYIWYYFIEMTSVAISWGDVALWYFVVLYNNSIPWFNESAKVMVMFMKGNTVINIPTVKNIFLLLLGTEQAWWNTNLVWCFPSCISIKSSEIYCSPGWAILHKDDHHVTPCYWFPMGTGSITPSCKSWSSPAVTSFCQCAGTGTDARWATRVALGLIIRCRGFGSFMGSGWWLQMLNVLEA